MPRVFSYGTLQDESVQLATFGRTLVGQSDVLPGAKAVRLVLDDPALIASSGRAEHTNLDFGDAAARVAGTAFSITDAELARADGYEETAGYKRIEVTLASGLRAWVYVFAATAPGG
jgi:gamma-glutamylcyclotransferase (GGCT)/AIG2-like uncharacterized protein YtfP